MEKKKNQALKSKYVEHPLLLLSPGKGENA